MKRTIAKLYPTKPWFGEEIRQHKRVRIFTLMVFRIQEPQNHEQREYKPADLIDISLGGMKFRTNFEIDKGIKIKIRLRLFEILALDKQNDLDKIAEEKEFVVNGEVMHKQEIPDGSFDYGFKIDFITQGNIAALYEFIEKFATTDYPDTDIQD